MPKNKGKGGRAHRKGKNKRDDEARELVFKDDEQEYGQVTRILGNCRVMVWCYDGKERLCHIRGKMRKKVWINQGDIVLVSLRDFQDQKGDIILKYYAEEARKLKMYGELPDNARINEGAGDFGEDDDTKQSVVFGTSSTATALEADLEGDGKQKTSDILAELLGDSGSDAGSDFDDDDLDAL